MQRKIKYFLQRANNDPRKVEIANLRALYAPRAKEKRSLLI
jgi:hypothetical protein